MRSSESCALMKPGNTIARISQPRPAFIYPLGLRAGSSTLPTLMSSTTTTTIASVNFQFFLDALADYAKQTGIDLTNRPFADKLQSCHSPESVLDLLQDKAREFKDYREGNRNLINCLSPVVQALHVFSPILSEVAGFVPFQPTKAIFIGVDVLLSAAIGVSTSYDALVDLFECVASFLKRLHIFTEGIPFTPAMTDIIVKVLVEILSVLALATKQIKQGRFKKFAKKLSGESEIEAVLQRLNRLTLEEGRITVAQTLEVVHGLVRNVKVVMDDGKASVDSIRQALVTMHETTSEINKMKRDQLQERIRNWLSPPDPSKNHNIARTAYHGGTSTWFTQGCTFNEWKTTGSLLWIHGKPGSGKSILCSTVIQQVKEARNAGLALMGYFYFDFRDNAKQDVRGLLSSLLAQFSAKSDSCYHILSDLYSEHDAGSQQPDCHALTECLKKMLKIPELPPVYIIVDALDECPDTSGVVSPRERVLDLLKELVDLHLPNLHLCITSRPEADIRSALDPLASRTMSLHNQTGQNKDIVDYINSIVHSDRKMRRWRAEDKQLVIDTLSQRAGGMFRWVVCQLETLRRTFPAGIRHALDGLPQSLDETYARTLLGISRENQEYAQRLFECLVVSVRPLHVEELAEIFAMRFQVKAGALPDYNVDWRLEDPEEAVLTACSSLIAIVNVDGSPVVQFSHFSVKEFLISDRLANAGENLSCYHIVLQSAHTILAKACLSILLQLDDQVDKSSMKNFPIAMYAAQHWTDHAQFEDVSSSIQDAMGRLFDRDNPYFSSWVWTYDIGNHFVDPMSTTRPTQPDATPLYYATLCGFRTLVEHLVATYPQDVNARGGYHTTPLHAALAKGYVDIAMLLLEHGADVNVLNFRERSPLHIASRSGRYDIVEFLIEHDADVNIQNKRGLTPLMFASLEGELEVVRVLLEHGAAPDSRDDGEGTQPALMTASQGGHVDVVQLLLQNGAAVDCRGNAGWTPLEIASQYGHLGVVRLLCQNGAAVDSRDDEGWTSLTTASRCGHLDIVRLLLHSGAAVDSRNNQGSTPLHIASTSGHLDIVQELRDHGADPKAQNDYLGTALHIASYAGNLEIAQFLVQHGADVDAVDQEKRTPLSVASDVGELEVARWLIQCGADVTSRDKNGQTPCHIASQTGHLGLLHLLLDHGTDVDALDDDHDTPLALASWNGELEVSRFLIDRGANVNSNGADAWTSLHLASQNGHFENVRLLLDHGVDVNAQTTDQWTPLHLASAYGYLNVAELLTQRGADIHKRNEDLETPLHLASGSGEIEIARLLIKCGSRPNVNSQDRRGRTSLHTAAQNGHLNTINVLLESGADVNMRNSDDETPLDMAIGNGKWEITRFLADRMGIAVDSWDRMGVTALDTESHDTNSDAVESSPTSSYGNTTNLPDNESTSLYVASIEGNIDMVRSLLDRGADVNERNEFNWTPLHVASAEGRLEVATLLIQHGADVHLRQAGWTPLHMASESGHLDTVLLLLDHGADVNARTQSRWTSLHLASSCGHVETVMLLLERGADAHVRTDEGWTPSQVALRRGEREVARILSAYGLG